MTSTTGTRTQPTDDEGARGPWTPVRLAGAGLGSVYLLVGVVGFVLTGVTSWSMQNSATILLFQINPIHNVAHLGLGAALLVGGLLGTEAARSVDRLVGFVFLLLTAPIAAHLLSRAAYSAGYRMWQGSVRDEMVVSEPEDEDTAP